MSRIAASRRSRLPATLLALALLAACASPAPAPAPASTPAAHGATAPAGKNSIVERSGQSFGGTAYRSFNAPYSRVKAAAVSAINTRSYRIVAFGMIEKGESIKASSRNQNVAIELERLLPGAAELRVTVRGSGLFADREAAAAIVAEVARIIEQTRPPAKR